MYSQTSGHVGEYYGTNFLCTESTSYHEKKEKARIKFMNFSQKYMGSVFFLVTLCIYIYIYIYIYIFTNLISTSIHGTRKKQKHQRQEIKYLESLPGGKKKKIIGQKKEKANLVLPP